MMRSETRSFDAGPARRQRDPRLDFFRGVGMLIIVIAHIPENDWIQWIPARFGFSDATEMFVFLSGMASAIAFASVFDRHGMLMGLARVAHRVWQVYWAHLCVFVVIAALMVTAGTRPGSGVSYVTFLNLDRFFDDPRTGLTHLLTLTYVPNYFDILPMYLVILALMPVMMAAERVRAWLPFALMIALWALTQARLTALPADPWVAREWFFNPFGWQLLFFTGFFLMRGRLPSLPPSRPWLMAAALIVVVSVPFAWFRIHEVSPLFADAARMLHPFTDKTHFGILRFVHFLAVAYLAACLTPVSIMRDNAIGVLVQRIGQQSLAVFMAGMVAAQIIGIALDHAGRTPLTIGLANLAGFLVLAGVAIVVGWFKSTPWKTERRVPAATQQGFASSGAGATP
jgi:hypothetical protein